MKLFLLLYADDAAPFSDAIKGLQDYIGILSFTCQYCKRLETMGIGATQK